MIKQNWIKDSHKYNYLEFKKLKKSISKETKVTIASDSMSPWILTGDSIHFKPSSVEQLKKFDIIIFWSKELEVLICHIFYGVRDDKLITKPLYKNIEDPPCHQSCLLGTVTSPRFKWYHKLALRLFYR